MKKKIQLMRKKKNEKQHNIAGDDIANPSGKILLLEKELAIKTEMIGRMQLEIEDLRHQKFALLISTDEAINQLRSAILMCKAGQ